METWERIILGAVILLIIFWRFPKMGAMLEASKGHASDWNGLIWPLLFIGIVIFVLISLA